MYEITTAIERAAVTIYIICHSNARANDKLFIITDYK
jgi:hypothetical protein